MHTWKDVFVFIVMCDIFSVQVFQMLLLLEIQKAMSMEADVEVNTKVDTR